MPDLFAADELAKIVDMVRTRAKAAGKMETKDALLAYFVNQCRENLHDWFLPWPSDALTSVAQQFLAKADLGSERLGSAVCNVCMSMHRMTASQQISGRAAAEHICHAYQLS